jgi:hypothetical protein
MLGEATLDVSGTLAGEAKRVLILFTAQHQQPLALKRVLKGGSGILSRRGRAPLDLAAIEKTEFNDKHSYRVREVIAQQFSSGRPRCRARKRTLSPALISPDTVHSLCGESTKKREVIPDPFVPSQYCGRKISRIAFPPNCSR